MILAYLQGVRRNAEYDSLIEYRTFFAPLGRSLFLVHFLTLLKEIDLDEKVTRHWVVDSVKISGFDDDEGESLGRR